MKYSIESGLFPSKETKEKAGFYSKPFILTLSDDWITKPERPIKKIPFQKMVIDSNNDVFEYIIENKKAVYIFMYSVFP